jgi:RNA polymerase sigma-B factor
MHRILNYTNRYDIMLRTKIYPKDVACLTKKIDPLVVEYCKTKNPALRDEIIVNYKSLVEFIARKLAFNRSDTDDLVQIGSIAILKALDRFDVTKETDFATFATPNIIGEIKHYFRDKSQVVKVPRKLQELNSKIKNELREAQKLEKTPTVSELAKKLDISEEQVLEAMEAGQNIRVLSLDAPSYQSDGSSSNEPSMLDQVASQSKQDNVLNKETIKQAILHLEPRERRILYLRFYGNLSQSEIAERLRLSQMHISRLLAKSLKVLRKHLKGYEHDYS